MNSEGDNSEIESIYESDLDGESVLNRTILIDSIDNLS
jgi:hypothetical protein